MCSSIVQKVVDSMDLGFKLEDDSEIIAITRLQWDAVEYHPVSTLQHTLHVRDDGVAAPLGGIDRQVMRVDDNKHLGQDNPRQLHSFGVACYVQTKVH